MQMSEVYRCGACDHEMRHLDPSNPLWRSGAMSSSAVLTCGQFSNRNRYTVAELCRRSVLICGIRHPPGALGQGQAPLMGFAPQEPLTHRPAH